VDTLTDGRQVITTDRQRRVVNDAPTTSINHSTTHSLQWCYKAKRPLSLI